MEMRQGSPDPDPSHLLISSERFLPSFVWVVSRAQFVLHVSPVEKLDIRAGISVACRVYPSTGRKTRQPTQAAMHRVDFSGWETPKLYNRQNR
jgi:hypothetical protein